MHRYRFVSLVLAFAVVSLFLMQPLSIANADGEIQLAKVASSSSASVGDNITYTYTITNNSTDNLTGLQLADDKIGVIDIPDQLASGENITVTDYYIVSETDYSDNATQVVNIATLTSNDNITAVATETVDLNPYVAALEVTKEADPTISMLGDVITYTYIVTNNGDVGIDNLSLSDDKLGDIPLLSDNVTVTSILPGDNITAEATYKVALGDLLAGSIKNTATATGQDPNGNTVTASSPEVTVSTNIVKALLSKAEILKLSGVPGKGIDTAPGLQIPFNSNSQASEHAGKKDGKGNLERNQQQEMNGNIEQNQSQEVNSGDYQNNEQNQGQKKNKNNGNNGKNNEQDKGKGQGKGLGKNK